jgi:hypothetical protein
MKRKGQTESRRESGSNGKRRKRKRKDTKKDEEINADIQNKRGKLKENMKARERPARERKEGGERKSGEKKIKKEGESSSILKPH